MKGTIDKAGNQYEWWAGPANPDAEEDYCVHCRRGDWGVTEYLASKPSEQDAEKSAQQLIDHVDRLQ